jgi:tetratricopeptide (TPR) repeat protein
MLLVSQGKYGEAEPVMKEALAIAETALGPTNTEVTNLLSNMGEVYRRQKNYSEARLYMERALSMAEKTSGASSLRTAGALIDIALLDIEEGRFEEAKPLEERLFKIQRSEGTKSLLFGVLVQFSGKYVDKDRCETAVPLLKEAAQIKREFPDEIDRGPKGPVQTFEVLTEKCGAKLRQGQGGRP